jgi:uncharacterized phiE125 gp8 family phage protein
MFQQIWRRRDMNSATAQMMTNHVAMTLTVPPAVEPVTLTQLKQQARIPYPDSDDILSLYLVAAREMIERYLRRALITQTWDFKSDWGVAWIELPYPNLQTVNGVYTTSLENIESIVPTSVWIQDPEHNFVGLNIGNVWPLHRAKAGFRVNYTSGYGPTAASVPATIKRYILALATQMDNTRDDVQLTETMMNALSPYRVHGDPYRMAIGMAREDLLA